MNYYAARERIDKEGKGTGVWKYTCANDGRVWEVGYCSSADICPDCKEFGFMTVEQKACKTCSGKGLVDAKIPCDGHATPEEAEEHYKQYLLDKMKIAGPSEQEWPKYKCYVEGCNEESKYHASLGGCRHYELCAKHANRETVSGLFKVGWSCSSY